MGVDSRVKVLKENPLGTRASWEEYGMLEAIRSSVRSSCLYVRSGSYLENFEHKTRGTGYNGASSKREHNCLEIGCQKQGTYMETLDSGNCIGIHSEMNCIYHRSGVEGEELHLFTTILPCPDCSKNIEPFNITRVVFKKFYSEKETQKSLDKLEAAGIEVCQLDLSLARTLDILVNEPDTIVHGLWAQEEKEQAMQFLKTLRT